MQKNFYAISSLLMHFSPRPGPGESNNAAVQSKTFFRLHPLRNFLFLLLALGVAMGAQAQIFNWAIPMGGNGATCAGALTQSDNNGNVYVIGDLSGTVDFDPGTGLAPLGPKGLYLAKYSAQGTYLWARIIVEPGRSATIYDFAVDAAGKVYVTGTFSNTAYFTTIAGRDSITTSVNNNGEIFFAQYNETKRETYISLVFLPTRSILTRAQVSVP
jgi:hypothetical protein